MIKKILKKIDRFLFPAIYLKKDSLVQILKNELLNINTVLDVGCGVTLNSPLLEIAPKFKKIVGIDLFEKSIQTNLQNPIYSEYFVMNALDILKKFGEKSFDCIVATDLIEHLTFDDGMLFIELAQKVAREKIILLTPNGFLNQNEYDNNKYQIHQSGWGIKDFKKLGFNQFYGINGVKFLRGEEAKIRFKPEKFWFRVSLLSSIFTKIFPNSAFQILAIWKKTK